MNITQELLGFADLDYKEFSSRLMPGIDKETVIGIRTPILRKFAKTVGDDDAEKFLAALPHKYYEENNLHAFLIENINDFDRAVCETERFLPYVDNWATCDCFSPKIFAKNTDRLLNCIEKWLASGKVYTIRYGIGMLMRYFLGDNFRGRYPEMVAACACDEYYINMMIAWYFATALAKRYDDVIAYLEENRLPVWVHNKTISKACDSYRVSPDKKTYLKSLRRK